MRYVRLEELELREGRAPVFAGLEFATPWSRLDYVGLDPGQNYSPPSEGLCEEGYVVLEGSAGLKAGEAGGRVDGPGVVLVPIKEEHRLANTGDGEVRLLHVRVEMEQCREKGTLRVDAVDAAALKWRDAIHGGAGRMATRHLWGPEDFLSTWTFMDHAVLGPDSSVGYHYHDALEECFVVLKGRGYMTIADETFTVGPGSATWQGIGQGHGIYNPEREDLEFLRIAVALADEEYTTVDLHDDLFGRGPV